jgi:hypothetical protein
LCLRNTGSVPENDEGPGTSPRTILLEKGIS